MSTPTIQLAFQGGGAKLAAMLPIAHAFRDAESDGFINIQRTSGTSAGSICAALVAVQADFDAVRTYLVDKGPSHLAQLIPARLKPLIARSKVGEKFGLWSFVRERQMLLDVAIHGEPLLTSSELRRLIDGLLAASRNDCPSRIEDCPIQLFITASDVVTANGILHEQGNIAAAVEDSCSLPILLRSFSSLAQSHYVDGGLCDNLPVDCLVGESQLPIFAVFPEVKEEKRENRNILSYFVSLLSASINHNVRRSISIVGKPFRFPANTDIGLLDFDAAIDKLSDDNWYRAVHGEALARIQAFSKSYGFKVGQSQARVIDSIDIEQFRNALDRLTAPEAGSTPYTACLKGQFIVEINHDRRSFGKVANGVGGRVPDTITRVSRMRVLRDGFRFYRASVNVAEDSIVPTIWSARNITRGTDIPISALPLGRLETQHRELLVEFLQPETHFAKDDIIELQSSYHSHPRSDLRKLNLNQPDYFGFVNNSGMAIDEAELILIYPKSLGNLKMFLDTDRSTGLHSSPANFKVGNGSLPLDMGQDALGFRVADLQDDAGFFVTVIPT